MAKVITLIPGQPDKTDEYKVVEISREQTLRLQTTLHDLREQKIQTEALAEELKADIKKAEEIIKQANEQ